MFARISSSLFILILFFSSSAAFCASVKKNKAYKEYIAFFEKVYKTFEDNYYIKPDRNVFNDFIKKFDANIYAELAAEGKSQDYVRWRGAWYLVDAMRSKEDRFSQFYPPKPAQEFKQQAYGQRIDLGIEGSRTDAGFQVTRIEPRSDAYVQGLREEDVILKIDGAEAASLSADQVKDRLSPLIDTKVTLMYQRGGVQGPLTLEAVSKEYFRQTVFLRPVAVPGIVCLDIQQFNRMTGDDMLRFMRFVNQFHPRGLVLDLRGNPGGPPLAAREIAAFFLKGGDDFVFFQRRGQPRSPLDVPVIDEELKFEGPMVILVDAGSGSSSELFSGVMQFRRRAKVMGVNTAGQVLLKDMFDFDDGSMVGLVTGRGYMPDGSPFSFNGVTPDAVITDAPKDGLIDLAAITIAAQEGGQ